MDSDRVKELHSNVRHITQLAMSWFAFFVTVNYVAMSWLAKGSTKDSADPAIVQTVAIVFIAQNVFGVFGLTWVLVAANAMKIQVTRYENPAFDDSQEESERERLPSRLIKHLRGSLTPKKWKSESIPYHLYIGIGTSLMLVLISLIVAWIIIAWHYGSPSAVRPASGGWASPAG